MNDVDFITTKIDIGTVKLVAEILRHERGEDELDFNAAAEALAAACNRLGGVRRSKPNA